MKTILLISPYWREPHRWMVSTVKLAELWQRRNYNVVVACMGSETQTFKLAPTLTVHMRKDTFLPDPWNYGIAFGFNKLARTLARELQPDVIVVNKVLFWTSLSLISLRLRGKTVILLTDALVGMTWWPRGLLPKIGAAIYAWTIGWIELLMASHIVFFHPQPEHLLHTLGIAAKSRVIPTGIDPAKHAKVPNETSNITITYVGRLESVKGVDDFLAAVVPLKKEFPHLIIQVVGWYAAGHSLVSEYGNDVQFTGLREDIPAILNTSDIFVLPSYSEGLSNALMEAMASGNACIATEVGGNRYLIENGVSGLLYPAGDREALRSHVRRLMQDPAKRKSLSERARARIEQMFDWKNVGDQYEKLFTQLHA